MPRLHDYHGPKLTVITIMLRAASQTGPFVSEVRVNGQSLSESLDLGEASVTVSGFSFFGYKLRWRPRLESSLD